MEMSSLDSDNDQKKPAGTDEVDDQPEDATEPYSAELPLQHERVPPNEDISFSHWRQSRHGDKRHYFGDEAWYAPQKSVLRHPFGTPSNQASPRTEYLPYYYDYPFPPRPYHQHIGYDQGRWEHEDYWKSPGLPFPAEERAHFWTESMLRSDPRPPSPHPRPPLDYGYRPLWRSGVETPPQGNRNPILFDVKAHSASRRLMDWHPENQFKSERTPPNAAGSDDDDDARNAVLISAEKPEKAHQIHDDFSPSTDGKYIYQLRPYDVLCGRGVPNKLGAGNAFFKDLVKRDQLEYISCKRNEKPPIATNIIEIVRAHGGRFLRRVKVSRPRMPDRYAWSELAENRIYEKVCQALRDGAPQIRQRMIELDSKSAPFDKENSVNQFEPRKD